MKLSTLIAPDFPSAQEPGLKQAAHPRLDLAAPDFDQDITITGLTADSRQVTPGVLFAAIPGTIVDGAKFAAQAAQAGAAAILAAQDAQLPPLELPVLRSRDPRRDLALLAARFYGAQPPHIIAITGTSGKTSVAEFTRQIFAALGHRAASLGTIGLVKPDGSVYGSLTTPDPVALAKTLAELAAEGVSHLALEASSHGLDQARLDGVRITIGAFTNLGRDHLDYHATVTEYFNAKKRLFSELLDPGFASAVVFGQDEAARTIAACALARGLNVSVVGMAGELGATSAAGIDGAAGAESVAGAGDKAPEAPETLRLVALEMDGFAQLLTLQIGEEQLRVRLPLIGAYQVYNALLAAGIAISAGEQPRAVVEALPDLQGVRGRLEIIGEVRGGLAVVDYAHKPEALEAVLHSLRPFVSGKLILVFGCGGDRDKGKRALMGKIAARLADVVIVTDDNPRTEPAAAIRAEIMATAAGAHEIGERGEAIAAGAAIMGAGDVLVVAGKGHETGQIVGDKVLPFSDHEVIARALGL